MRSLRLGFAMLTKETLLTSRYWWIHDQLCTLIIIPPGHDGWWWYTCRRLRQLCWFCWKNKMGLWWLQTSQWGNDKVSQFNRYNYSYEIFLGIFLQHLFIENLDSWGDIIQTACYIFGESSYHHHHFCHHHRRHHHRCRRHHHHDHHCSICF